MQTRRAQAGVAAASVAAFVTAAVIACASGADRTTTRPAPTTRAAATAPTTNPTVGDKYTERFGEERKASFDMVFIPAGTFWMGSPANEPGREASEGPRHQVRVEPFWMGRCEVTAALVDVWLSEWRALRSRGTGNAYANIPLSPQAERAAREVPCEQPYGHFFIPEDPIDSTGTRREKVLREQPAITLTAYGAQQFCRWLTVRTGRYYRLPTEAEWEYACRARTESAYPFGADAAELGKYASIGDGPQPVGVKAANAWGLHDMLGNVGEYVLDDWIDDYRQYAGKLSIDPWRKHLDAGSAVVRGGNYEDDAASLRSAARRRVKQRYELNNDSRLFNYSGLLELHKVGLRVASPVRHEGDGRENCIPPPPG